MFWFGRSHNARRLALAFPAAHRPAITPALRRLPASEHPPKDRSIGPVWVCSESIHIPVRIYEPEMSTRRIDSLTELQQLAVHCVYTRHHDGLVRQRHVKALLSSSERWTIPFVVQLVGEYVIEILDTLEAGLPNLDQTAFGAFVRENPAFMQLTRSRMISYWNCYYRDAFPALAGYVGQRFCSELQAWADRPP